MWSEMLLTLALVCTVIATQNDVESAAMQVKFQPSSRVIRQPVASYGPPNASPKAYSYPAVSSAPYAAVRKAAPPTVAQTTQPPIVETIPLQPDGLSKDVVLEVAEERDLVPEVVTEPPATEELPVETTTVIVTTTVAEMTTAPTTTAPTTEAPTTTAPTTTAPTTEAPTTTAPTTTIATSVAEISTTAPAIIDEVVERDLVPEIQEEVEEIPVVEAAEEKVAKVIFITVEPENSTVVPPEVAQYYAEKHEQYGFARTNLFPQSILDASSNVWNSGRDDVGKISSFSYFRNDKSLDSDSPVPHHEKFRNLVTDKFNRNMDDRNSAVSDWDLTYPKEASSGSAYISSPEVPVPKKSYGVPKAAPFKYAVPKTSYGVPKHHAHSSELSAPEFKNVATLTDIIVPKRYLLEGDSEGLSSLPPAK